VPADPSSSIPAALAQLAPADPLRPAEPPHLLAYLATVHDPRRSCGRRHPLVAILAMAAAAVLTGARSMAAIAAWAADAPQPVRAAFGARRDAPDRWVVPTEATIRRTLGRVDPTALAAVIGAWLADRDRPGRPGQQHRRRAVAVDGKTLRGAKGDDGRQVHLLAATDHATRAVLAQRHVGGAPGRGPGPGPAVGRPGPGRDGGHRRRAAHPRRRRRVPGHRQAGPLPAHRQGQPAHAAGPLRPPGLAPRPRAGPYPRPRPRPHRAAPAKAVTVNHFGFPHLAQVLQVTRKTRELGTRRWRTVVVYAITSLTHAQASPARLADLVRNHWAIESCCADCAYG
jgi:DDE_Tnp_1-associated